MQRRFLARVAACLTLALPGLAGAQTVLQLASGYPITSFHVQNLQALADDVRQRTNGQLQIHVQAEGKLFKAPQIRQAVADGKVAMGEVFGPGLGSLNPVFALDALPFLATDYDAARRLWNLARPLAEKRAGESGLALLMSVPWPPQGLFASREIRTVDDFKGLPMRENSPSVKRMAEMLGAAPVTVESADLAAAMQQGRVRLIFTSAAQGVDTRIWESLPWYYQANAWLPRNLLLVNKKTLDGLPANLRDALIRAAAAAEERGWQLSRENAAQSLESLRAAGMKVGRLDGASRARLDRVGTALTADLMRRSDPELLSVLSAYLASAR
jgi:TRAP-type C4-dicarboxylate transport system substrate-binding protein